MENNKKIQFTVDLLMPLETFGLIEGVSFSHIYLKNQKESKPILIKKAGSYLDKDFIEKIKSQKEKYYETKIYSEENVDVLFQSLKKFESSFLLFEKQEVKNNFTLWLDEKKYSLVEWSLAFERTFSKVPEKLVQDFSKVSEKLYLHSKFTAMLSSLSAILLGYDDPKLIQDIYHVGFFLDSGFLHKDFSYFVLESCEHERLSPGSANQYFERVMASKKERDLFLNHPIYSFNQAMMYQEIFYNIDLIEIIKSHHERPMGEGFPLGIPHHHQTKIESLISLSSRFLSYLDLDLSKREGMFLKASTLRSKSNEEPQLKEVS